MIGGSQKATALLASFLLATPALAEPKGQADKDKQLASDLVKKAIARSQAGDHAAAIEIYLQAYTIAPNSLLLSNIGAEFQQDNKPQEALRYFCMYLDKDPTGTNAPYATSQAKSLQIQLGNKHVDDDNVCAPPKTPARKPAVKDAAESEPEAPPSRKARREDSREAKHEDTREELMDTGEPMPSSGNTTLKYVGVGTGIAGLAAVGVGIYAGIQARTISDDITSHGQTQPWPDNIQQLQKRGQDYENLQIEALIAGGVLVATGTILFMVSRPNESPKRGRDKPSVAVTPTTNGFAVFGTY
jgi:hypothetical protein